MRMLPPALALVLAFPLSVSAKTATWFVNHDTERNATVAWCLDNPGPARRNKDCAAASQANAIVAQREAEQRIKPLSPLPPVQLNASAAAWLCPNLSGAKRVEVGCPTGSGD